MLALVVMIVVKLTPAMPAVFWFEPGNSCASYALWQARADAYADRNRIVAYADRPHGSCSILYIEGLSERATEAELLAAAQARARDPYLVGYLYMQVPEFETKDYVKPEK